MTAKWYDKKPEVIAKELRTNLSGGLSKKDAAARIKKYGRNTVYPLPRGPFSEYLKNILTDWTSYMLLLTAVISGIYRQYTQAIVIISLLLINIAVTVVTFIKAHKVFEDMGYISLPDAKVIREGKLTLIKQDMLVPGDIILISAGDIVPADCRLVESENLLVNELDLTDAGRSVVKDAKYLFTSDVPLGERKNMIFTSSIVTSGSAKAIVCDTGVGTLLYAKDKARTLVSHDKLKILAILKKYCKRLSIIMLGLVFILTVINFVGSQGTRTIYDVFISALSMAVASMSEFYATFGYILVAIGIFNALTRYSDINSGAVVKNVESIEQLKDVSCIIVPRESLISLSNPEIERVYADDKEIDRSMRDFKSGASRIIKYAVLSTGIYTGKKLYKNNIDRNNVYTAEEESILSAGNLCDVYNYRLEEEYILLAHRSRGSSNRFDTTLAKHSSGNVLICRGDVSGILSCSRYYSEGGELKELDKKKRTELSLYASKTTKRAYKVIAVASRVADTDNLDRIAAYQTNMIFEGFICIKQPVLEGAGLNIKRCREAGIKVIMTTKSMSETDVYIANSLGIIHGEKDIMDFSHLEGDMLNTDIARFDAEHCSMYRGITPAKLKIVIGWLKEAGYKVASLSRGLPDLALIDTSDISFAQSVTISPKAAKEGVDIRSISEGGNNNIPLTVKTPSNSSTKGCDAVKFLSDVVVSEPEKNGSGGFNAITGAIACSKVIYQNIYRMIRYFICAQLSRIILFLIATIAGGDLLTSPQLLLCGLILDFGAVISIAFERPSADILNNKDDYDTLFKNPLKHNIGPILLGSLWGILPGISYLILKLITPMADGASSSFVFLSYIFIQIAVLFEIKKDKSLFKTLSFNGISLIYIAFIFLLTILSLMFESLGNLFNITPLSLPGIITVILLPVLTVGICELYKFIRKKFSLSKIILVKGVNDGEKLSAKTILGKGGIEVNDLGKGERGLKHNPEGESPKEETKEEGQPVALLEEKKEEQPSEEKAAEEKPDPEYNSASMSYTEIAYKLIEEEIDKLLAIEKGEEYKEDPPPEIKEEKYIIFPSEAEETEYDPDKEDDDE